MLTLFTVCTVLGSAMLVLVLLEGQAGTVLQLGPNGAGERKQSSPYVQNLPGKGRTRSVLLSVVSFVTFFGLGGLLASWLGQHLAFQWSFALLSGVAAAGFTAFALILTQTPERTRGELLRNTLASHELALLGHTTEAPTSCVAEGRASGDREIGERAPLFDRH